MGVIEFVIKFYTHQSKDSFPFHPDTNISGRRCTFESLVAPASEGIRRSPRSIGRCALELRPVQSAVGDGKTIRARPYGCPIWGAKMLSQKIRILSPGVQKSRLTHRVEVFVCFMSAQRWALGGNSTKLAHPVNTR